MRIGMIISSLIFISFFSNGAVLEENKDNIGRVHSGNHGTFIYADSKLENKIKTPKGDMILLGEWSDIILLDHKLNGNALKIGLGPKAEIYTLTRYTMLSATKVNRNEVKIPNAFYISRRSSDFVKSDGLYYTRNQYKTMADKEFSLAVELDSIEKLDVIANKYHKDRFAGTVAKDAKSTIKKIKKRREDEAKRKVIAQRLEEFVFAKSENSYEQYLSFYNKHNGINSQFDSEISSLAYKLILKSKGSSLKNHVKFTKDFHEPTENDMAIKAIAKIVMKENNTSGYSWFIQQYGSSNEAKNILSKLHELSFKLASQIDTVNAYNDFIIAFPTAKQTAKAENASYELEKSEYTGFFTNEEKEARALLIQSKMLEQSAEDLTSNERIGYVMVVNRMNNLLKSEFNRTEAALRHLESNEFKSFVKTFKSSMHDLKRQVARIAANTEDLSSIMKNQSKMMDNHFENAAQDREMATELTEQHRFWERYIGEVGY